MPSRKSNVSVVSNGADEAAETTPAKGNKDSTKDSTTIEDLTLPKSMIARLAKGVLPANTQIQKDALLALHKSATVFVSYIASTANENAQSGGKKTISPLDVMAAMKDCEFEDFLPRLEAELKKYNEIQCDKRNTYRRKVKEVQKAAAVPTTDEDGNEIPQEDSLLEATNRVTNGHAEPDDEDRPAKKVKGLDGAVIMGDVRTLGDDEMSDDLEGGTEVYEHQDEDDGEDADEEDEEDGMEVEDDEEDDAGGIEVEDRDVDRSLNPMVGDGDSDAGSDSD